MTAFVIDTVLYFILIFIFFFVIKMLFTSITIYQYERGIKFYKGKFKGVMEPGKYTYFTPSTKIEVFDMRPVILQINGQELLSADNVNVKISLAVKYQVKDPQAIISEYQDFQENLYTTIQLKLRDVISTIEIDRLIENRQQINSRVKDLLTEDETIIGLSILAVDVKDIMLSAELKKAFSEVLRAKKEAQAALEKARGEAATLRSLANTAKVLANNPELAHLRLVHTIEASKGNTFIINASSMSIEKTMDKNS